MNLRGQLSAALPGIGSRVVTYAYPENRTLDFRETEATPALTSDYYEGRIIRYVPNVEYPPMDFPLFETTVEIRSGASGGPMFDEAGHIFGINCRGWDFRGGELEGDNLSYVSPIHLLLDLHVDVFGVPAVSWEAAQLPSGRRSFTVRELADLGHIVLRQ
jgi:hypothetical protein